VLPNAYAIVDSGHGFKMLALGHLAADDILEGEPGLDPYRLSRFARGETHLASAGPYPWT
jgi:glycine/D-amino acid oxidase-like deaminating enzyme